jgi:hypothetical protein
LDYVTLERFSSRVREVRCVIVIPVVDDDDLVVWFTVHVNKTFYHRPGKKQNWLLETAPEEGKAFNFTLR